MTKKRDQTGFLSLQALHSMGGIVSYGLGPTVELKIGLIAFHQSPSLPEYCNLTSENPRTATLVSTLVRSLEPRPNPAVRSTAALVGASDNR